MNIIQRLKEPSTWAGIGMVAMLLGMTNDQIHAVSLDAATIAGAMAILLPEGKK